MCLREAGFPGLKDALAKYQAKAPELKIDPLGHSFVRSATPRDRFWRKR